MSHVALPDIDLMACCTARYIKRSNFRASFKLLNFMALASRSIGEISPMTRKWTKPTNLLGAQEVQSDRDGVRDELEEKHMAL